MTKQDAHGLAEQDARTRGATAAMERAEAAAIRRAARTRVGTTTLSRILASAGNIDEQHPSFDGAIEALLKSSERTLVWVADELDGLRLPDLPNEKPLQLGAACLHIAIEHAQALVVLTQEKCFGSALALQRPLSEAYARGLWLLNAATAEDVDRAGQDDFPRKDQIVAALKAKSEDEVFTYPEAGVWAKLCSYTHTGYIQIGARLTEDGLRSNYTLDEVRGALRCADMLQLASAIVIAVAARKPELAQAMLDRLNAYPPHDSAPMPPNDDPRP